MLLPLQFKVTPKQQVSNKIEITVQENRPKTSSKNSKNEDIKILGDSNGPKATNFYWGIGIMGPERENSLIPDYFGTPIRTCVIYVVFEGYGAYLGGVLPDDIIYEINGQPITAENDLRGDGPKQLNLTILRKNAKIHLTVNRTKVYY